MAAIYILSFFEDNSNTSWPFSFDSGEKTNFPASHGTRLSANSFTASNDWAVEENTHPTRISNTAKFLTFIYPCIFNYKYNLKYHAN
ncbi:hypothetical protein D3C85_1126130 [compost metagenome]